MEEYNIQIYKKRNRFDPQIQTSSLGDGEVTKSWMKKLRVVVAEDNDILRLTLTSYLRTMAEVNLVGEAKNGEEALRCVDELDPDLLTLDMYMPKLSGWGVLTHLQERQARVKVIVFSTGGNHSFDRAVFSGVVAHVRKENPEVLAHAVRDLAQQKVYG